MSPIKEQRDDDEPIEFSVEVLPVTRAPLHDDVTSDQMMTSLWAAAADDHQILVSIDHSDTENIACIEELQGNGRQQIQPQPPCILRRAKPKKRTKKGRKKIQKVSPVTTLTEDTQWEHEILTLSGGESLLHTTNAEITRYKCGQCGLTFTTNATLYYHEISTHREQKHVCKVCLKTYSTLGRLHEHEKIHKKEYRCEECDFVTTNERVFQSHTTTHQTPVTREKFQCRQCREWFESKAELRSHEISHKTPSGHVCEICNKEYQHLNSLQRHRRTHDVSNAMACEFCEKTFSSRSLLNIHRKRHMYSFFCPDCGAKFNDKFSLKRHVKSRHSNGAEKDELRYACTECEKKFATKQGLQLHLDRHFQVFTCGVCTKTFRTREGLKRHEATHQFGSIPRKPQHTTPPPDMDNITVTVDTTPDCTATTSSTTARDLSAVQLSVIELCPQQGEFFLNMEDVTMDTNLQDPITDLAVL